MNNILSEFQGLNNCIFPIPSLLTQYHHYYIIDFTFIHILYTQTRTSVCLYVAVTKEKRAILPTSHALVLLSLFVWLQHSQGHS